VTGLSLSTYDKRSLVIGYTKIFLGLSALILSACSCVWAQDPGWPGKLVKPGGTVLIYQPQVDDWQNSTDIKWRQAFQLTPTGGKEVDGAASFEGTTEVNTDNQTVFMFNIQVLMLIPRVRIRQLRRNSIN
jgi:hypothetical protein